MKRLRVAVLFGGRSVEHEVSCRSARNVIQAMDKKRYEAVPIAIDLEGHWYSLEDSKKALKLPNGSKLPTVSVSSLAFLPGGNGALIDASGKKVRLIDVVFPVLHGSFGEDGTMQGLLKLADVPFVGVGVTGSAVGMDKDVMKRLLRDAGLPVGDFLVFTQSQKKTMSYKDIAKRLGSPFFLKPASLGSSVGVAKVRDELEFKAAVNAAFSFDVKILCEKFIPGREIECAVLGNDDPKASIVGEIEPTHEFYSYDAKYLDENGAVLHIPAKLPAAVAKKIQDLAVKTFKTLSAEGLSRVDFFVTKKNEIFVNEINTLPGFTSISMYPKLWEKSGVSYAKLIDKLIVLARERFEKERKLKMSY